MLKVEKRNHAATIEKPSRNRGATVPATMPRNRATVPYRGGDMVAPSLSPSRLSTPRLGFALAFGFARRALTSVLLPASHLPAAPTGFPPNGRARAHPPSRRLFLSAVARAFRFGQAVHYHLIGLEKCRILAHILHYDLGAAIVWQLAGNRNAKNMSVNAAQIEVSSARTRRHRARHRTVDDVDKRSRAGRRAAQLMAQFEAAIGGNLTDGQKLAVSRAAIMTAIAEDARVRKLNGSADVNLDDLVRLDRVAALAVRALGIKAAEAPKGPTLAEHLAKLARERVDDGLDDEDDNASAA